MADVLHATEWKHLQTAIVFCVNIAFILQRTVMETQLVIRRRHHQFTRLSRCRSDHSARVKCVCFPLGASV